ncbi:MAG TPA: hypothetical protein VD905_15690 [Flavobacteriales bacterium]|nr:hypothetical protein [Flavobacteriales bacterium]
MAYVSITRLGVFILDKLNKLNAGNLSAAELDELKELTTELNERIVIMQYKAHEMQLLKMAGQILDEKKEEPVKKAVDEPIKLNLGTVTKPVEPARPLINDVPAEEKIQPVAQPNKVAQTVLIIDEPVVEKSVVKPEPHVIQVQAPVSDQPVSKLSLAQRMQKTKIDDLNKVIGLNQKFLFMNYLFEGENTSYNDAIEKLNRMPTIADARHYIRELAYIYSWNYEDENVVLFTEFVERRYL